jgi:hypothetical protein
MPACIFAGDASQKLRRLGRELRDLRGKTKLPVTAAAACFVRQDAERPDKVRCCIIYAKLVSSILSGLPQSFCGRAHFCAV